MEPYNRWLHVRITESEKATLGKRADQLGMTSAALVRALINLPIAIYVDDLPPYSDMDISHKVLLFDQITVRKLLREISAYGNNYNQAVRALNYLQLEVARDFFEMEGLYIEARRAFEAAAKGQKTVQKTLDEMLCDMPVYTTVRHLQKLRQDAP